MRDRADSGQHRIEELSQEARYRRERLELYRARLYGGRAANMSRLAELERAYDGAAARLARAKKEASAPDPEDGRRKPAT
jgi:hypothetical protein